MHLQVVEQGARGVIADLHGADEREGGEPPPRHREAPRRFGEEPIHDGVNEGAHTWFTVVSGQVVQVDTASGAVVNRYDLPAGRMLQTWVLEDAGISSIFSVLPAQAPA